VTAVVSRPEPASTSPPVRSRPSTRPPTRAIGGVTEISLAVLTLAAAVSLARLFHHPWGFLGPVGLTIVAVHVVAWACRRRGVPLAVAALASAWAAALVLSWTVLAHATFFGLPTRGTLAAAGRAMSAAMDQFRNVASPAPVSPGFVLAGGVGGAAAAFLADWAAFRMRATTEACLPSLSLFVFSAALAQGHRVTIAVIVWLGALLSFLLVREAGLERPGAAWFASRSGGGPGSIIRTGSFIAVLAVLAAITVGPHLPGATTHALLDWRHDNGSGAGRTTGSPLVDIRARILNESNVEVFTVSSTAPEYWRLTSLDTFDGNGWSLNDTYRHIGSSLPAGATGAGVGGQAVTATFAVTNLQSIWLPAPFRPVRYKGPGHVSYSADAGSLIADKATTDGMTYQVTSLAPSPSPAALAASPPADPSDPAISHYLELPPLPPQVRNLAIGVTATGRTAYDKALLLQDFFRNNFTYDLNVPADDSQNAIVRFLTVRRGFCQQFAGTYAAMARLLGLPTRVAVGFTPGVPAADGRLHVTDAQAHAWPEVWFAGQGWVAFEPTPGRGAPNAQGYTGVQPQQNTGTVTTPATTPTTVAAPGAASSPTTRPPVDHNSGGSTAATRRRPGRSVVGWAWRVALWLSPLLLLGITPLAQRARRARRRAAATTPGARVELAWNEAKDELAAIGALRRRADTPSEYAATTARAVGLDAQTALALTGLAHDIEQASYTPHGATEQAAEDAEARREMIALAARDSQGRWERCLRALDPRRLRTGV